MEEQTLKKSYKGFVIWLVVFTVLCTGLGFLPFGGVSVDVMVRLIDCGALVACTVLMYMVWRSEAVYWFTGITYEQARDAGPARRRAYALRHLRLFAVYTGVFVVFSLIMQLAHVSVIVDAIVLVVTIFAVSVRTMFFKL